MPLYVISHYTPLSSSQKDALAAGITRTHTGLFTTPSLFVNVRFEDINQIPCYVGGIRKLTNTIIANVRPGPSRPRSAYDSLCHALTTVWDSSVSEEKLDTVFILANIVAGYEQGFMLPEAGGDVEWIKKNFNEFERRAGEGDEGMSELVQEVREKGLLG